MPMLASPYGAAAKLNCLSPPLPTIGSTASRKSFHPWKKMTVDGHYPFTAHAPPHYPAVMTSALSASRDMMSSERSDGSAGGFAVAAVHGYSSYRGAGTGMSGTGSCAMAPACVLPPGAGATAVVHTGIQNTPSIFHIAGIA